MGMETDLQSAERAGVNGEAHRGKDRYRGIQEIEQVIKNRPRKQKRDGGKKSCTL